MRCCTTRDYDARADYRAFGDDVVGRRNGHLRSRIDAERAVLRPLPPRRTDDFDTVRVRVTSSGGFILRREFYSVPSRMVGHQLTVHVYDDRLELFLGATPLPTLVANGPPAATPSPSWPWLTNATARPPSTRARCPTPERSRHWPNRQIAARARRCFERHLAEAKLPPGKTLDNFEFQLVPTVSRARTTNLVHRATIFELNVESYRRCAASAATHTKRGAGRVADRATPANTETTPRSTRSQPRKTP